MLLIFKEPELTSAKFPGYTTKLDRDRIYSTFLYLFFI